MNATSCSLILCAVLFCSCNHNSIEPSPNLFPKVKVIIQDNCTSRCHTTSNTRYPNLGSDEHIVAAAEAIKRLTVDSPVRMPPDGELSQANKDIILQWYLKGGKATD